jgi:hypothetical protein
MDWISANWRKSSYSGTNGGQCVEVGTRHASGQAPGAVLIRDTTEGGRGPILRVSPQTWRAFTTTLRATESVS